MNLIDTSTMIRVGLRVHIDPEKLRVAIYDRYRTYVRVEYVGVDRAYSSTRWIYTVTFDSNREVKAITNILEEIEQDVIKARQIQELAAMVVAE